MGTAGRNVACAAKSRRPIPSGGPTSAARMGGYLIAVGWLSSLFGCGPSGGGRFHSEDAYAENRARQVAMAPRTVAELRKHGVSDRSRLRLEYFFYTDTPEKAAALARALADLGYDGRHERSAGDPKLFVVTGWTTPIGMDEPSVVDWAGRMCDVGREHDCEFDGWGTNPDQP